ncbi:MAG TPA: lactate racemase domain-containing protein [Pirellulales bacterium]|nr:lactate racemase domain-containing protein [Pirellulales bacterium]
MIQIIRNSQRRVKLDFLTRRGAEPYDGARRAGFRMISTLRYGTHLSLSLELPSQGLLAHCDAPRGEPLLHVAEAVDRALAEPLEFPQLAQAAVPGDKVVLALAEGVPQAPTVVARTIEVLLAGGVSARDITLLRAAGDCAADAPDLSEQTSGEVRRSIAKSIHDPTDRGSLCYLAATSQAKPIYINRAIHDADVVVSIGCLRLDESLGYYGINSCLFPTFSDEANLKRYRLGKSCEPARRNRLRNEADQVSWLLGVQFTIQIVPGAGTRILHVLSGSPEAVFRRGSELCSEAWSYSVPRRANLVIATIEGDATQQTWHNVARALAAASQCVSDEGAIAICTDLAEPCGPALQRLIGAEDLDEVLDEIDKQRPADAVTATQLAQAMQRGKVYLISRLAEDLVEDLGILPVTAEQISRLAARYESSILLANAQYAIARPRAEVIVEPWLAEHKSRT